MHDLYGFIIVWSTQSGQLSVLPLELPLPPIFLLPLILLKTNRHLIHLNRQQKLILRLMVALLIRIFINIRMSGLKLAS
jgi:hypothetical protein